MADYKQLKAACKKAGLDTSVMKDDFQDKAVKLIAASAKLKKSQEEAVKAADELRKTATKYIDICKKWEHESRGSGAKAKAAEELSHALWQIEQQLILK